MTLDDCVYALADLLDKNQDHNIALDQMTEVLKEEKFSVDEVIIQFEDDYKCTMKVYVENLFDDDEWEDTSE